MQWGSDCTHLLKRCNGVAPTGGASLPWGCPALETMLPLFYKTREGGSHSQTYLVTPRIKRKEVCMFAWAQGGQSAEGCACEVGLVVRYGAQHAPPSADPTPLCMKAPISALGPRQIYPTRPLLAPDLLILRVSGRGSVGWLAWSAQAPNWNQRIFGNLQARPACAARSLGSVRGNLRLSSVY